MPEIKTVPLSSIVFDEVIYPRSDHDPVLVQRYAEVLEEIEAAQKYMAVSADMKLLDGKHRWLAYRKRYEGEDPQIQVLVYSATAPHEKLKLAAKLNSEHGWQLTDDDKEATAKSLYAYGVTYDDIAATLSVGKAKVSTWLARTVKEQKKKRDKKIFELWLQCFSTDEIAEACNCGKATVSEVCSDKFLETLSNKPSASHLTDFEPPIYNIWRQQEKSNEVGHFGNSEVKWVDNLLYLYTEPFDIVVDPCMLESISG